MIFLQAAQNFFLSERGYEKPRFNFELLVFRYVKVSDLWNNDERILKAATELKL